MTITETTTEDLIATVVNCPLDPAAEACAAELERRGGPQNYFVQGYRRFLARENARRV